MQCGAVRELCLIPYVTSGQCVSMPVCIHVRVWRNTYVHISFTAGVCLYEAEYQAQIVFEMCESNMTY